VSASPRSRVICSLSQRPATEIILGEAPMQTVFASLPLVAAVLTVPQFLPQLARVRSAGTVAGVSWSWAALTSVNNAAWLANSRHRVHFTNTG
jgi:hypothetical protein